MIRAARRRYARYMWRRRSLSERRYGYGLHYGTRAGWWRP